MTEKQHFNLGPNDWDVDAILYSKPEDGGLVLKNVSHGGYQLATDIRVVSVWAGTSRGWGDVKPYYLGSEDLPQVSSIKKNTGSQFELFAKYPQLLDISADFKTPGPVLGKAGKKDEGGKVVDDSQPLSITQRYIFTNYSNFPGHEPAEGLTAARLYPLVTFSYVGKPNEAMPLTSIRVVYRIEVSIEMEMKRPNPEKNKYFSSKSPVRLYHIPIAQDVPGGLMLDRLSPPNPPNLPKRQQLQQVGVFKDIDVEPKVSDVGFSVVVGTPLNHVFTAGQKPLPTEMIGSGISKSKAANWDNIHIWGRNSRPDTSPYPTTPGMNHGLHLHWRWGKLAAGKTGDPFFAKGGKQFSPRGAGVPLIDTTYGEHNLRFAITGDSKKQNDGPWRAFDHSSKESFDDQFIGARPVNISNGAPIVLWLSMEIYRPDYKIPSAGVPWEGTFFLNGIYFPHNPEFIPEPLVILRLWEPMHQPATSQGPFGWYRP